MVPKVVQGQIKVLFVGLAESSHSHSWMSLITDASEFEARIFGMPHTGPNQDCPVPVYNSCPFVPSRPGDWSLYPSGISVVQNLGRVIQVGRPNWLKKAAISWLKQTIRKWKPDIVHSFGIYDAGLLCLDALNDLGNQAADIKWVAQMRGGSDVFFTQHEPEEVKRIIQVLNRADAVLTDNVVNLKLMRDWKIDSGKIPSFGTVQGTGGIDPAWVDQPRDLTSTKRMIFWPKAYECEWSKSAPVLEAIRCVWEKLQPCSIKVVACDAESRNWIKSLPLFIRSNIDISPRISRGKVLKLMRDARIMLGPSLVDGTPNVMFEAMGAGAVPLVSPLETIVSVVQSPANVLFARNLYPQEIAANLVRAMSDDVLVDRMAAANRELVKRLANRDIIRTNVRRLYTGLVQGSSAEKILMTTHSGS